jgi:probable F420-dependent oxidoreductase
MCPATVGRMGDQQIKVGVAFANAGPMARPELAALLAEEAEAAGVESLWTVEHPVIPVGYQSQYPYNSSGKAPGAEVSDIPDPFVWLAYVAARTTRIQLGTGIVILPLRNPVIAAKQIATLDQLSGGRVQLGIGVGWLQEEFEAVGVPWERRGLRTDEAVAAMRALWSDTPASYSGETVSFADCIALPKPVRAGGVPIVIGGHTEPAARRAGRLGDGFFPGKGSVEELSHLVNVLREAADEAGRDASAIELTTGMPKSVDQLGPLVELGFTRFIVPPPAYDEAGIRSGFARLAEDVISKLPVI